MHDVAQIAEHSIYANDYRMFALHKLRVRDPEGVESPFKFRPEQTYLWKITEEIRRQKKPVWLRVYKSRKIGASTFYTGDMLHQFQYSDKLNWGEIYGDTTDSSGTLYGILLRFYDGLPPDEKRDVTVRSQNKLFFQNGTKIFIRTVKGEGLSKSGTPNYLLFTEVASYGGDTGRTLSKVLASLPDSNNITIIQESTSEGHDAYWYDNHKRSKELIASLLKKTTTAPATRDEELRGITSQYKLLMNNQWLKNEYFPIFIPWFWNKRNRVPLLDQLKHELKNELTEYEKAIMNMYCLDLEQVAWRRMMKQTKCDNDEDSTKAQYPCSADESFIASGNPVFDTMKLDTQIAIVSALPTADEVQINLINNKALVPERLLTSYNLYWDSSAQPEKVKTKDGYDLGYYSTRTEYRVKAIAVPDLKGTVLELYPPEIEWLDRYVIGVDCAEGLAQKDYDCALAFDKLKRCFCAFLMGRYGVDQMPMVIAQFGTRYNMADILFETRAPGPAIVVQLRDFYPNLLLGTNIEKGEELPTAMYGVKTSVSSKHRMISMLRLFLDGIPSNAKGEYLPFKEVLEQMKSFVKGEHGEMSAAGKLNNPGVKVFDDAVMTAGIALEADRLTASIQPRKRTIQANLPLWMRGNYINSQNNVKWNVR